MLCFQIGANINEGDQDDTTLLNAAKSGKKRAVLLVKAAADVNLENCEYDNAYTALVIAILNNHDKCVAALIKARVNVNLMFNGYQVTFETKSDHLELATEFFREDGGFTIGLPVLQYAAKDDEHYKSLELLIQAGADVNRVAFDIHTFNPSSPSRC